MSLLSNDDFLVLNNFALQSDIEKYFDDMKRYVLFNLFFSTENLFLFQVALQDSISNMNFFMNKI